MLTIILCVVNVVLIWAAIVLGKRVGRREAVDQAFRFVDKYQSESQCWSPTSKKLCNDLQDWANGRTGGDDG